MKNTLLLVCALLFGTAFAHGQTPPRYQLSSHILDITTGKPAARVPILLSRQEKNGAWKVLEEKRTDSNGRVQDFLPFTGKAQVGIYKLTFQTNAYFKQQGVSTFYPFVEVVFELTNGEHYHVPITLSPFGYSTYRGS